MWARLALVATAVSALSGAAAASPSADVSLSFQDLGLVLTAQSLGLPAGTNVMYPTAAALPDGRIRVYYAVDTGSPETSGILSAISSDGVHFLQESGRRWMAGTDSDVEHLPDGRWRLYYSTGPTNDSIGIASAISEDGLSFTDEPGLRLANPVSGRGLSCCGTVRLADGRYRMYVTSQYLSQGAPPGDAEIYSAVSSNLVDWTLEPGIRTLGRDPAALANPDGSTLLAFALTFGGIATNSSSDGLAFGITRPTNLVGDFKNPAFVTLPDGRLLMYYGTTYDPDRGAFASIGVTLARRVTVPAISYPTPAVTAVTASSAHVAAVVDPNGDSTSYTFDYGTSTAYGNDSGWVDLADQRAVATVGTTLSGLRPGTTYHVRAEAYNSFGSSYGTDQTFTTAKCPAARDRDRGFEVALAHGPTRSAATRAVKRAARALHVKAVVERDGCPDYETAVVGLTRNAATKLLHRARRKGFRKATLERT